MRKAISVFIMDVSNSSKFKDGFKLSTYLTNWEKKLIGLKGSKEIIAKHRMGDEIICLVEGYSSAMIIANYMIYNWVYEEHMPYFGVSCDFIDDEINNINIETWNHPVVKNARLANESIKNDKNRRRLIDFRPSDKFQENELELMKILLNWQSIAILEQTKKQREVLKLYSNIGTQKEIANKLKKSTSTISAHFTGGKIDLILNTADSLYKYLSLEEVKSRLKYTQENIEFISIQKRNKNFAELLSRKNNLEILNKEQF